MDDNYQDIDGFRLFSGHDINYITPRMRRSTIRNLFNTNTISFWTNAEGRPLVSEDTVCYNAELIGCIVKVMAQVEGYSSKTLSIEQRDSPRPYNIILEQMFMGIPESAFPMGYFIFIVTILVSAVVFVTLPVLRRKSYFSYDNNMDKCNESDESYHLKER